ncbi:ABC transporter ATP-binding protein [Variovorax sp. PCZ-1]|uniref:ABC transporter ATP-binding protein n=1 Tax=Variovorax sp. PCZ-1 TaxID=2835533 RepID=UPI001BCA6F55|nr:ABC transporter ATP-binding protein [Variovorax sp. PCZ-1]MBS7808223.1 ABC transporter ATP-binding protein [Variovorax sp. PCZ-1]
MSSKEIAIRVENLSKCFAMYAQPNDRLKQFAFPRLQSLFGYERKRYYKEFWALQDISFEVKKGETVGIIGRNGSGKSTLLQMICGTLTPTTGSIQTKGRIAALLELGSGFNPEFTGLENIHMNAAVLGLSNEEIDQRLDKIIAFADIGEFIDQPVKTYSSGMMVRLAFSVAIHVEPDILVVDEALSVGDAYFQAKCAKMIQNIIASGSTVLFVSHDTASVKSLCSRALLLDSGRSLYLGEVNTAVEKYYTALVHSQRAGKSMPVDTKVVASDSSELNDGIEAFKSHAYFQRISNGVAEFINVSLANKDGQIIDTVEFGQTVVLRQVLRIHKSVSSLGLAYHIRDKNGKDIIYSDTALEGDRNIVDPRVGNIYVVEWEFTAFLREGAYVISSMLSEPINMAIGEVDVIDFVPISTKFVLSSAGHPQIYAAAYWSNSLRIRELNDDNI